MPERIVRALIDTSVVIDLATLDAALLPAQLVVSSLTLAELAAGPHATQDTAERARRQDHLQRTESTFEVLAFDAAAARSYGRVYAAVLHAGRLPRGRAIDLLIASTAIAAGLPLLTRNAADFTGLEDLLNVLTV